MRTVVTHTNRFLTKIALGCVIGVLAVGWSVSCTRSSQAKNQSAEPAWRAPYDHYYGVYLQGRKVGWMRMEMVAGKRDNVIMRTRLVATMAGMGDVSKMELTEERRYGGTRELLQSIVFKQTAATGTVEVRGDRASVNDETMHLTVTAGGQPKDQQMVVTETLNDALLSSRMAVEAKAGTTHVAVESTHFDASLLQLVQARYEVKDITDRVLGGVTTQAVGIVATYPALQVTESMVVDRSGQVLETHLGGFFEARLEPEETAKRLDVQHDLLLNAVVKTPAPITMPEQLEQLQVTFVGFADQVPPVSARQHIVSETRRDEHTQRDGDKNEIILALQRDPIPGIVRLGTPVVDPALKEDLLATPFIQSDAPQIKAAARRAVGDAKDVFTATSRLAHFVFGHVQDAYVPAYSNALEAFQSARGDCTEHSVLFVALARALGIPARVAVGIAYWPPGNGFGWHAWAEVYAGGQWYSVDPTWDQPIADATHIKLAGGGPMEQARIVMLLGRLRITSVSTEKLARTDLTPKTK